MPANRKRLAGCLIHVHDHRVQFDAALRRFHLDRHRRQKFLDNRLLFHADDGIVRSGHTAVCLVRRAARQDARVGGGNMRVRPHHRRNTSVQIPAHRHLLAGHLGMEIDEPDFHFFRNARQHLIDLPERTIGVGHVHPALQIHHGAFRAASRLVNIKARAGSGNGIVGRPDQPGLPTQVIVNVPLVPDVIAGRHHVDAGTKEILGDIGRDAEARGRVFAVRDHHINALRGPDIRQMVRDNAAARMAENIADKK